MGKKQLSTNPNKVGLDNYFNNPVPLLSHDNVAFLCNRMDNSYDYFIEYGLGSSTLYFLDKFRTFRLSFISVENNIRWFNTVIEYLKHKFTVSNSQKEIDYFTLTEIYRFASQLDRENPLVPSHVSRRNRWKEALLLGPLFRFSPRSNSRVSGVVPFWPLSRWPMFMISALLYLYFPRFRPARGEFRGKIEDISLVLRNVGPAMKDQYYESPSGKEYIDAGLLELRNGLQKKGKMVKAAFLIDGGPRAAIVRTILNMEETYSHFYPTIFLCEAHRAYYNEVMSNRPSGIFLSGSNVTINGLEVQGAPGIHDIETMNYWFGKNYVTKEQLAEKEVWFYERAPDWDSKDIPPSG